MSFGDFPCFLTLYFDAVSACLDPLSGLQRGMQGRLGLLRPAARGGLLGPKFQCFLEVNYVFSIFCIG